MPRVVERVVIIEGLFSSITHFLFGVGSAMMSGWSCLVIGAGLVW